MLPIATDFCSSSLGGESGVLRLLCLHASWPCTSNCESIMSRQAMAQTREPSGPPYSALEKNLEQLVPNRWTTPSWPLRRGRMLHRFVDPDSTVLCNRDFVAFIFGTTHSARDSPPQE